MVELPTRAHPQRQTVRYTKTRIAVTRGPSTGRSIDAAGTSVRALGLRPECELVVEDDTVSRQHCEIELTETGLRVRDTASTNGVRVGGISVYDAVFHGAITLEIGETVLTLTPLPETVDREQVHRDRLGDLLGSSRRMRELYADLERIASTDVTVLVEGETGTRQGSRRGDDSSRERASRGTLRRLRLQRGRADAHRERAVRSRAWRVHRCGRDAHRRVRAGSQGTLFDDEIGWSSPRTSSRSSCAPSRSER